MGEARPAGYFGGMTAIRNSQRRLSTNRWAQQIWASNLPPPYLLGAQAEGGRKPEVWPGVPRPRRGGKLLRKTGFGI